MAHDINIFVRIENIKLGFFPNIGSSNNAHIIIGIFNILNSKDTELISALVLVVIYTLAVVYIVHIVKAYCKKKHITIFQIKRVSKNTTRKKTTKTKRNSTKPKKTATSKKNTKTKAKTQSKPKTQAKKTASR